MIIFLQILFASAFIIIFGFAANAGNQYEKDIIKTSEGDLTIYFLGHGSLLFNFKGKNIYIDPFSQVADYSTLPEADLVLISHEHRDHLDPDALKHIQTSNTKFIISGSCSGQIPEGKIMKNGDKTNALGLSIEAVPAYNLEKKFHPKGIGNGYVITFGDKRVYVAGDTENIPEMKMLKNIDIAFLPMNLPFTMTPEMVADAAGMFNPKILYPYHYGDTDTSVLVNIMKGKPGIEVRIRQMQ